MHLRKFVQVVGSSGLNYCGRLDFTSGRARVTNRFGFVFKCLSQSQIHATQLERNAQHYSTVPITRDSLLISIIMARLLPYFREKIYLELTTYKQTTNSLKKIIKLQRHKWKRCHKNVEWECVARVITLKTQLARWLWIRGNRRLSVYSKRRISDYIPNFSQSQHQKVYVWSIRLSIANAFFPSTFYTTKFLFATIQDECSKHRSRFHCKKKQWRLLWQECWMRMPLLQY